MNLHQNITRIKAVSNLLEDLKDDVVFIGGATVSCYADRPYFEPRVTDDVDIIVEIFSYLERQALEGKLRSYGFVHDVQSGIICRYQVQGIIVDIMPRMILQLDSGIAGILAAFGMRYLSGLMKAIR